MEEFLIAHLLAHQAVAGQVDTRVWWEVRPQGSKLPAIVLHRIDGSRDYHMGGPSGLVSSRVQVDCWGASYGDGKRTARAVVLALSGLKATHGEIEIQGVFADSERDFSEEAGASTRVFRTSVDFIIWHTE